MIIHTTLRAVYLTCEIILLLFSGQGQRYNKKLKVMCKSRIFAEILNIVSSETEVPASQILSKKKDEETVDARYLLVYSLSMQGLTQTQIARLIGKDVRTVNNILNGFEERGRTRKMFGINLENIRKQLGNK